MTIHWSKTIVFSGFVQKFVGTFVGRSQLAVLPTLECPFASSSSTSYIAPTQSTQGNVVNFCYDRLRDNPTIAKHFVYLSHSHKSSRILKAEKEKAKIFWLVFRSQRCDSAPHWQHPALTLDRSISILIAKSAPVIKPDTPQNTEPQKLFANSDFSAIQRRKLG